MRKLIAAVAVLAVILVVLDRVALVVVETRIGDVIQTDQHLKSRPQVKIGGFPFLTQILSKQFDSVRFDAAEVSVGGADPLVVASVSAQLRNVRVAGDLSSGTAQTASGSGVIGYPSLSTLLGAELSWGGVGSNGRGRLTATRSVTVLGQQFHGTVSAQLLLSRPNVVGFTGVQLAEVGLPQDAVRALEAVFQKSFALSGLPIGLTVNDISAQPQGVALVLQGHNLHLK
jgi:hypothetical protein